MHLRTRPSLYDMWSSRGEHKQPRGHHHNYQLGSKDRLQIRSKHSTTTEIQHNVETTKAVAWAVFQHHGGGDGRSSNHSHNHSPCNIGVRRCSRFKIEAQMRHEVAHRSLMPEVAAVRWDAGSTLFDSFELDSLLKTLDQASHPNTHKENDDDDNNNEDKSTEAGAVVVYSPNTEIPRNRFLHEDDEEDDGDSSFELQRYVKPGKGGVSNQHTMWKSLLHSLHLDGSLFHGLQKLQSQVAPHDSSVEQKDRRNHKASSGRNRHRFGGRHRQAQLWNLSVKAKDADDDDDDDLRDQAWAAATAAAAAAAAAAALSSGDLHERLRDRRHRQEYAHRDEGEDYEMTIQAISRRVPRTSFEEKFRTRRMSLELEDGLSAPRNSLDVDAAVERGAVPLLKPRSVWGDGYQF